MNYTLYRHNLDSKHGDVNWKYQNPIVSITSEVVAAAATNLAFIKKDLLWRTYFICLLGTILFLYKVILEDFIIRLY